MNRVPHGWKLADEWFTDYIRDLEASGSRKRRLFRERHKPLPIRETQARAFAEKTEQLRRFLEHEREVQDAAA